MSYYITGYNGIDLQAACGLVTPGVSGVHDLMPLSVQTFTIPGGSKPHITAGDIGFRTIPFKAAIVGDDHADLAAKLALLRGYIRPDRDFHSLVVADRLNQEIMARNVEGFRVSTDILPNDFDAIPVTIPMLCYPFWQSDTDTTDTVTASPDTLVVGGTDTTYPTYTCSILVALATGLWFEVSGHRFIYTGALEAGDSLVVDTDDSCPDVKLNGVRDWEHVSSASAYPSLNVGNNPVSFSDPGSVVIDVSWRERSQ